MDSWKEIANYLGKGVRTVQRWEATEGLPVRRLGQDRNASVFAYKSELDEWWKRQSTRLTANDVAESESPGSERPRGNWGRIAIIWLAGCLVLAAVVHTTWTFPVTYQPQPFTTEHGWEVHPSFSKDGRTIAYVWSERHGPGFVYVKAIGADSGRRLTKGVAAERSPVWSPDGRMIAFLRDAGKDKHQRTIVLIPAGGGPETVIGSLASWGQMQWSPDGQWLLSTEEVKRTQRIVAVAVSTGAVHEVLRPEEFGYSGFGLSPDMERLVFRRSGPGAVDVREIKILPGIQPEGPERTLISRLWMGQMVVTPDARAILYTDGIAEEGIGIWRHSLAAGGKPELIHKSTARDSMIAISPDQRRLVFAADRGNYRQETWRLRLDGVTPVAEPLLSTTHSDMNPDYSPDGSQIAFHSTRTGASDIWIADRKGENSRRLTFTNARTTATPRWSPDGGRIVFESNETGQSEVYVIRSNGGPAQRLTQDPATDAIPSWSPDGRWIYFCSDRTGRFEIWKVSAAGGEATQVTHDGGFAAVASPDGKYLYYSQTRNFGPIWRMPLTGGAAEMVATEMRGLFFAVTRNGVYYQAGRNIWRWEPASKQAKEIFRLPGPISFGLAASPDGKELLFTQVERHETDLYLIDGLR